LKGRKNKNMTLFEIRERFLEFYRARGHAIIPSASLVPENDPTTLFTGSGMQPLIPYLLGAKHPEGVRLANSQKSFRAEDIEEVGDNRHTTFFEMLGNWSLGDYWKQDQLPWFFEFLTKEVGLKKENLYVSVFSGGEGIGRDDEAIGIWQTLFADVELSNGYAEMNTEEEAGEKGMGPNERIFGYGVKKNWWSRAGMPSKMPAGEPGGPDSEVFYDFGTTHDTKFGKKCHPNCDCGRFMEIGNSVFMEYKKKDDGSFEKLKQRNVDFGGGLERITAASNGDSDVFHIDVFAAMGAPLASYSAPEDIRHKRIILDHLRAAVHLIGDGVEPSNKERGYILRRLLRRAIFHVVGLTKKDALISLDAQPWAGWDERTYQIIDEIVSQAVRFYPDLQPGENKIKDAILKECGKFTDILKSRSELEKVLRISVSDGVVPGDAAFVLFSSHGLPIDYIKDEAQKEGLKVDQEGFQKAFKRHQDLSRTASAGTFKGGLADHSETTTRLHTAHHLLLKALQTVLGPQVKQRGSNITSERLRMDFSYDGKMTDEQKKEVEKIVNEKIAEDLPVVRSELPREEAENLGAEHEFGQKYPDRVSVYSVGPKGAAMENPQFDKAFSIEFCGGPHVTHTGEIGHFRILKEEASSAGIRRIRGVVGEPEKSG
jgi:alanyl-tRNA synthetase